MQWDCLSATVCALLAGLVAFFNDKRQGTVL